MSKYLPQRAEEKEVLQLHFRTTLKYFASLCSMPFIMTLQINKQVSILFLSSIKWGDVSTA